MSAIIKQYQSIKAKYPDAIVLFKVGDNYETFNKDATIVSEILSLPLTTSNASKAINKEASFPASMLDTYLCKLVRASYKVAICDQLQNPLKTKGPVKRGVTDVKEPKPKTP